MNDENSQGGAFLRIGSAVPTSLMELLDCDDIQPGYSPSYQTAKTLYAYHPLGAKMAEKPIDIAQSQRRTITIPGGPEDELIESFNTAWGKLGGEGADQLIKNTVTLSRVYGLALCVVLAKDLDPQEPLPYDRLHELQLGFNVLDPLNTAGSLVMDQDPNSPTFLKPRGIAVAGKPYHPSRATVIMNEQPIYIEWTSSAYGFVGRSVYQRALFPLKSYIQSMITDDFITQKAGLLIMKVKSPGAVLDRLSLAFGGMKRRMLQGGRTNNVLSIDIDENVESLDLKNIKDASEFARNNILKNIAASAPMPASMLNDETLASGFGEGSEDAKAIATFIDGFRREMDSIYRFFDKLVRHIAWNPDFYASIQRKYPEQYADVPYETAMVDWTNAFKAEWPNLLTEPDSKLAEKSDVVMKSAIALFEVLKPCLDPVNTASAAGWLADIANGQPMLKDTPLNLDLQLIEEYEPPISDKEPSPVVESSHE